MGVSRLTGGRAAAALVAAALVAGCTSDPDVPVGSPSTPVDAPREPLEAPSDSVEATPTPSAPEPSQEAAPEPARRIRAETASEVVDALAGGIGPRPAATPAFGRAARTVERRLEGLGYVVRRQTVRVPAGVSWGVPVTGGRADNLVASLPGVRRDRPHVVVGAHLDTVPQAPGAEDNASGVGTLVAAAEATAERPTRLPVVFVVFTAEEPRGPSDDDHHYGSRHYVAVLTSAQRSAVRGMVSLDRVGVGRRVPVCSATGPPDPLQRRVLDAGGRAGVAVTACESRTSDHWSFVRGGLSGVRLGGTPYAEYHSARDRPEVVDPRQLARVGRVLLAWLAPTAG